MRQCNFKQPIRSGRGFHSPALKIPTRNRHTLESSLSSLLQFLMPVLQFMFEKIKFFYALPPLMWILHAAPMLLLVVLAVRFVAAKTPVVLIRLLGKAKTAVM